MLELRDISYVVDLPDSTEKKEILSHVNLTITDGFTALTGPNGGGKSTLAKIIAGIYQPTSGRIIFNGKDITDLSISERSACGISFAFQQPVRFKGICVKDLIRLAAGRDISISEACEYLSLVGLCAREYIDREVNASLSGGELKRIEIAQIIARGTSFSIFDEPEAGIDLWSFQNLIQVFENLRESVKGSILIISHQERILNIADHVAVVAEGSISQVGTRDEILPSLLNKASVCSVLTRNL